MLVPLLVVLVLILVNALYVAAEFAAVGIRRGQVRERAESGSRLAQRLLPIVEDPKRLDRYIATCQIGITLSSLVLGAYGQIAFTPSLARILGSAFDWSAAAAISAAAGVVLVLLTGAQVIFGELVPKSLALQFPTRVALATVLPTAWSSRLFAPFIWLLNGSALGLLRLLRLPSGSHRHVHSPEEIELLVMESRDGGLLEPEEHRMLAGALHLRERAAHQLMVPRAQVHALDVATPVKDSIAMVTSAPYTRIPVYEGDVANVIGIVHAKDVALRAFTDQPARSTRELARSVPFVPETLDGDRVLRALRASRAQMAIVQDEHGAAVGVITFEDVLAEMLGGTTARPPRADLVIERVDPDRVRLPGLLPISRAPHWLPVPEDSDAQTVAGVVIERAGRIPRPGDVVLLGDLKITVEAMTARRIDSLIVEGAPVNVDKRGEEGP